MVKYTTTVNFIQICNKNDNLRFNAICRSIKIDKKLVLQHWSAVKEIRDFVKNMDKLYHKYGLRKKTFFREIFRSFIVSDLRAMTILSITGQHNQSNMVLRHLIENLIYSLWADLISKFSCITDYLLFCSRLPSVD